MSKKAADKKIPAPAKGAKAAPAFGPVVKSVAKKAANVRAAKGKC